MSAKLWQLNDSKTGLVFTGAGDIKSQYEELFKRLFPNLNLDPSTPQGQLISAKTEQLLHMISGLENIANSFFFGGSGQMLDIWAWNIFRARRKEAVAGFVVITIEGQQGTDIPAGFEVSDGTLFYRLEAPLTIPQGGTIEGTFICQEVTENISLAGQITQIITPIVGVDRVENAAPSSKGVERESDSDFKQRCIELGSLFKNSTFRSILANVAQVSGVIKIAGYENPTDKPVTYKNQQINAHSFAIVILGGDDKAIAQAIADTKPTGAGMVGDIAVELEVAGILTTYRFFRPQPEKLKVDIQAGIYPTSPSSYADIIKAAVKGFVDKIEIGGYITQAELAKAIQDAAVGFDIKQVKFSKKAGVTGYDPIELDFLQLATIDDADISVRL